MSKASKILSHTTLFWHLVFVVFVLILGGCSQRYVRYQPPETGVFSLDPRTELFYQQWRGTPYLWGGKSKKGVDCSAFMQMAYHALYNQRLPRTTEEQVRLGNSVAFSHLRKGDLVFFKTGWRSRHVGMYLGNSRFLHAGQTSGVTISSLSLLEDNSAAYWRSCYRGARRF